LVALVDGNNHRDCTDRHVHRVCTDHRSPSVEVVVAFVDVHMANHTDEIVSSCSRYVYSDTIDQDRRRRHYFDLTKRLDNLDVWKRKFISKKRLVKSGFVN